MARTVTERRIYYSYGPGKEGGSFSGAVSGFCSWDELIKRIEDERWGSPFEITSSDEREVAYSDWEEK